MLPKFVRFVPLYVVISLVMVACTKEAPLVPEEPVTKPEEPGTVVVIENNVDKNLLLQLVNNIRAKGCNCGSQQMPAVSPLTWNLLLELAAANHTKDMVEKKYFNHQSPSGTTPSTRIAATGYNWKSTGENIASGPSTEEAVINGWLNSKEHCRNIMGAQFKDLGVARSGAVWTMNLGAK